MWKICVIIEKSDKIILNDNNDLTVLYCTRNNKIWKDPLLWIKIIEYAVGYEVRIQKTALLCNFHL